MRILTLLVLIWWSLTSASFAEQSRLVQGGFYFGKAPAGSQIIYNNRTLQLTEDHQFLIGFGRDAELKQQLMLIDRQGKKSTLSLNLKARNYAIERIEGISKKMMSPSEKNLQRIRREASLARDARQHSTPLTHISEKFIWPLKGRISGVYGSQRILNGEPRRPHFGIDIAAPAGEPIIAPAGGIVRLAHKGMFFSGKTLIIEHGYGLSSSFLHLSRILVKQGQKISQGEKIALVGSSGRVTGPHLDWRINWFDQRLDPALWVAQLH